MKFIALSICCFLLQALWVQAEPSQLSATSQSLIQGTVPTITSQKLAAALKTSQVVLLDTREKKEFEVSHLPGAHWVGHDDFDLKRVSHFSSTTRIIVYCSVGYRSEKVGEKLKKAGYQKVENLFAGLFSWANEGRPLEDKHGKTTRAVHGFNADWSRYLSPKITKILK